MAEKCVQNVLFLIKKKVEEEEEKLIKIMCC